MSFLRRMRRMAPSLMTRLALAMALVGLLPVGVLAYRLIGLNVDTMDRQVQSMHVLFARSASEQVSAYVANQLLLTRGLAKNPILDDTRSPEARALVNDNLTAWSAGGYLAIDLVNLEGQSALRFLTGDEETKFRSRSILDLPPGSEVLAIPGSPLPLVRTSALLAGGGGYVWVVSEGTELIAALDSFELGKDQVEVALTMADGTDLVGDSSGFPEDELQAARTGYVQGAGVGFTEAGTGVEQLGSYAPVNHTDWLVLSHQPVELAHQTALSMTRQAQLAVALVVVAIGLLSGLAYWSVVRPIRELAHAQRRLAGLGSSVASEGDEIHQLKSAFEALEQRMHAQDALDEVFLGRYQVLEVLGTGAMGTVFLGRDPKLQRKVAIKTIRLGQKLEHNERQGLVTRLLQEAITTARFNHSNIVAVYDVQDSEDAAFIAMEYVEGTNLENLVWKMGRLEPEQVIPLGAAIARGLAAAHRHGLVHRDIKPANILLGHDGSIKVVDFGIAELLSTVAPAEDIVFGTPGYLPPETLRGKGYDSAGDLFSLGAVLYFSLTGARAFEGKTLKEVVRKTLFSAVTPPSRRVSGVPPELESLVLELLSSERDRRPSDADTVAERLQRLAMDCGARWQLPQEAFDIEERRAGGAAYLPTAPISVDDGNG